MSKPFSHIAALVLLIVAVVHVYRLYTGLTVVVAGHDIPLWASWPAVIGATILAIMVFREAQRS